MQEMRERVVVVERKLGPGVVQRLSGGIAAAGGRGGEGGNGQAAGSDAAGAGVAACDVILHSDVVTFALTFSTDGTDLFCLATLMRHIASPTTHGTTTMCL